MSRAVKVIFHTIDKDEAGWMLKDVTEGKAYDAVVYAPDEDDDRGNGGCGLDYIVFRDDSNDRVGYAKDPEDSTVYELL